ncbi:hypothetical protein LWE69_12620 [Paenibacillus sp. UKAQ_18]|nr:hypothetical protein [Paenibacillus sp. UKAQ_18]
MKKIQEIREAHESREIYFYMSNTYPDDLHDDISYLLQQIEIKDKALEFYADYDKVLINLDCGKRAREALEGYEPFEGEDTNE